MNKDVLEGRLKEMRGQVKEWWGRLTNDKLDEVGGKTEQIIGRRQQRYGYTTEYANEEAGRRMRRAKLAK